MSNIPWLRAVLMPEVPYCYNKLVTNVIRAVKINVLSYPCLMNTQGEKGVDSRAERAGVYFTFAEGRNRGHR